jgi:hypothetical protein
MRYVAVALTAVILAGCAIADIGQATHREWSRDGATEQDLARDRRTCTQQAQRPTAAAGGEPTIATAAAESRRFIACMEAKGWR